MNPIKQEYIEAEQDEINKKNEKWLAEAKEKFPQIENQMIVIKECVEKLRSAGIPSFLFFNVGDTRFQYNTFTDLQEFDKNGNLTKESRINIHKNNLKFFNSFIFTASFFSGKCLKIRLIIFSVLNNFLKISIIVLGLKIK